MKAKPIDIRHISLSTRLDEVKKQVSRDPYLVGAIDLKAQTLELEGEEVFNSIGNCIVTSAGYFIAEYKNK